MCGAEGKHITVTRSFGVTCVRKTLDHGGSVKHSKIDCVREKFVFMWIEKLKILEGTDITQTLTKWHYIRVSTSPCPHSDKSSPHFLTPFLKIISILLPRIQLSFPSVLYALFPSVFSPALFMHFSSLSFARALHLVHLISPLPDHPKTRVGTLIVATIYLQLIQNRYMFRSFTVLQCSHQHCVQV